MTFTIQSMTREDYITLEDNYEIKTNFKNKK